VSEATVRRYLADPRFNFPRQGPWTAEHVEGIKRWAADYLQEDRTARHLDAAAVGDLARARIQVAMQLQIARRKMVEAQRAVLEQKYVIREELEKNEARKWEAVKKGLQQIGKALRQRMADESDPAKCQAIIDEAHRELVNRFRGGPPKAPEVGQSEPTKATGGGNE
jgi:hypothetical protein